MHSLRGMPYELDDDASSGYRQAIQNNQLNLALQYLTVLLGDFENRVDSLEEELAEANKEINKLQKAAKKKTTKSKTKKAAAAEEEKEDE